VAQQAYVLYWGDDVNTNLAGLNTLLATGQSVVMASPMSGTGEDSPTPQSQWPYSRAIIFLEATGGPQETAVVLWFANTGQTNLTDLNNILNNGWRVDQVVAMSGTGETGGKVAGNPFPYSRALVILRQ
jgi:hypothetical protein